MSHKEPIIIEIEEFTIAGVQTRTKNENEFNQETAKLPKLWEQFQSELKLGQLIKQNENPFIYGVYSDYDSDETGFYSVTAGIEVKLKEQNVEEYKIIKVKKGSYLVFENNGPIPQAIIEIWQRIWHYFQTPRTIKRAYNTDFEVYKNQDQCAVYIGIKS